MTTPWFRDRKAWAFIARRYLPWLAGLNLAWEALQLPLYTIWTEASAGTIALAIVHCTLGDMLLLGPGYTIFSEWLNTTLFRWSYSELMPTLKIAGTEIGLSPLLQWLLLPPLALFLARRNQKARQPISR
jgi:hypothetical protein